MKLILLFVLIIQSSIALAQKGPLTIGVIIPLSGPGSLPGNAIRNGIELALRDISPGLVRVIYEDDMNQPRLTATAFHKLLRQAEIDAVITFSAQPSLAIAPLAESSEIPHIAIAIPPQIVFGRAWVFSFYAMPERMADLMVAESLRLNYRRIARISSIHDGRAAMKVFFDIFQRGRISVDFDDEYQMSDQDFRPFLSKLRRRTNIDAIYANLYLGQLGIFARQARELGILLPIFTSEFAENRDEVLSSKGGLVGEWFVNQASPPEEFVDRYDREFPSDILWCAPNGYDIIRILSMTARTDGLSSRRAIRGHLRSIRDYQGKLGLLSATGDNRFTIPVAVKIVPPV